MTADGTSTENGEDPTEDSEQQPSDKSNKLVRLLKPIDHIAGSPGPLDDSVISPGVYNAFNFSIFPKSRTGVNVIIGVTSANRGEGKTTVASNLAVSLATVNERNTVIVDLCVAEPTLHRVFGTGLVPGLVESLNGRSVSVHPTIVPNLFVLPAGDPHRNLIVADRFPEWKRQEKSQFTPSLGLEHVAEFRNVVYSLQEEFDFVIIDMPSVKEPGVPTLLAHQMEGVVVVVDANRTKRDDIDKMFQRIHSKQVLGFVFNRSDGDITT